MPANRSFQGYLVDTYLQHTASAFAALTIVRSLVGAAFPLFTTEVCPVPLYFSMSTYLTRASVFPRNWCRPCLQRDWWRWRPPCPAPVSLLPLRATSTWAQPIRALSGKLYYPLASLCTLTRTIQDLKLKAMRDAEKSMTGSGSA